MMFLALASSRPRLIRLPDVVVSPTKFNRYEYMPKTRRIFGGYIKMLWIAVA